MSLRAKADILNQREDKTNIGKLLARLDADGRDEDAAEVRDLLVGEPLIGHTIAARVLNEEFADLIDRPVTNKQVEEWRRNK